MRLPPAASAEEASLCPCSIPACLMGSTSLEELYLGDNSLHGTIPALAQGSPLTAFLAPDQEVRALQSIHSMMQMHSGRTSC